MQVDVFFTPAELAGSGIHGHAAVVIDVLRATSTITQALASGARAIYPVGNMDEAVRLAQNLDRESLLLCGERRRVRIEGFDLGNSPREFVPDAVQGRNLVMATTNGTPALVAAGAASRVIAASLLNLGAAARELEDEQAVAVICAGHEGRFALEDAICAGMLVQRLVGDAADDAAALNDGAAAALAIACRYADDAESEPMEGVLANTAAGRQLTAIGQQEDVPFCARVDALEVVPRLEDRRLTA